LGLPVTSGWWLICHPSGNPGEDGGGSPWSYFFGIYIQNTIHEFQIGNTILQIYSVYIFTIPFYTIFNVHYHQFSILEIL
jgi:hypothetical protein